MIDISTEKLTIKDKLSLMQRLWDELSEHNFDSPEWHESILEARAQQYAQGEQEPMDWDDAKDLIRSNIK